MHPFIRKKAFEVVGRRRREEIIKRADRNVKTVLYGLESVPKLVKDHNNSLIDKVNDEWGPAGLTKELIKDAQQKLEKHKENAKELFKTMQENLDIIKEEFFKEISIETKKGKLGKAMEKITELNKDIQGVRLS